MPRPIDATNATSLLKLGAYFRGIPNQRQAHLLGLDWPLASGWRDAVNSMKVPPETLVALSEAQTIQQVQREAGKARVPRELAALVRHLVRANGLEIDEKLPTLPAPLYKIMVEHLGAPKAAPKPNETLVTLITRHLATLTFNRMPVTRDPALLAKASTTLAQEHAQHGRILRPGEAGFLAAAKATRTKAKLAAHPQDGLPQHVYVLALEHGCFYVGHTSHLAVTIAGLLSPALAFEPLPSWLVLHPPLRVIHHEEVLPVTGANRARALALELGKNVGLGQVRGTRLTDAHVAAGGAALLKGVTARSPSTLNPLSTYELGLLFKLARQESNGAAPDSAIAQAEADLLQAAFYHERNCLPPPLPPACSTYAIAPPANPPSPVCAEAPRHLARIRATRGEELRTHGEQTTIPEGFIYLVTHPLFEGWVKAGMTIDYERRLADYNVGDPLSRYKIAALQWVEDRRYMENYLLDALEEQAERREGEWFHMSLLAAQPVFTAVQSFGA